MIKNILLVFGSDNSNAVLFYLRNLAGNPHRERGKNDPFSWEMQKSTPLPKIS